MTTRRREAVLDASDRSLLRAVQANGRASLSELARALHLSVSATRVRLQSLAERNVITGYAARVDAEACGCALRAVVRMKVHGALYDQVAAVLSHEPQIIRCLRVTGESAVP